MLRRDMRLRPDGPLSRNFGVLLRSSVEGAGPLDPPSRCAVMAGPFRQLNGGTAMTAITHGVHHDDGRAVHVRRVSIWRPFVWLGRGISDLVGCAPGNLGHGLLMVVLGWMLLLLLGRHPYYVAAAVSGFLLVAPIMTTGICELSRLRATGRPLGFEASLEALAREGRDLFRFGAVLTAVAVLWFIISQVMLADVLGMPAQSLADTYYRGFVDTASRPQLVAYVCTGAVLALVVFVLSVVTVPYLIDRGTTAGEAVRASLHAVTANPFAMLVWAAVLTVLTVAGFATALVGMIVIIPLLGHATWHAYRDLIG